MHERLCEVAVLFDASWAAAPEVLTGVAAYAREHDAWTLYVIDDPWKSLSYLTAIRMRGIIGCIRDPELMAAVQALHFPLVQLVYGADADDISTPDDVCRVEPDNAAIGRMGAEHLLAKGHPSYGYVGFRSPEGGSASMQRARAFRSRIEAAGCECNMYLGQRLGARNWAVEHGELLAWLQSLPRRTALLACNDERARQVLEACRLFDRPLPDDIALLGVGNDPLFCETANPPLSSIEHYGRTLAYRAAAQLDRLMAGAPLPAPLVVAPLGVITRKSTDCLQVDDDDVLAALRFIRQHAGDALRVADVVAAVSASRATLKRKFQKLLGRCISAEIQQVRIDRAKDLLKIPTLSLKQVARRTGFPSPEYLSTVFHQVVGVTPKEYRQHCIGIDTTTTGGAAVGRRPADGE